MKKPVAVPAELSGRGEENGAKVTPLSVQVTLLADARDAIIMIEIVRTGIISLRIVFSFLVGSG
jgi:hypothetical protein